MLSKQEKKGEACSKMTTFEKFPKV